MLHFSMMSPFYFSILTICVIYLSDLDISVYAKDIKPFSIIYRHNGGSELTIGKFAFDGSSPVLNPYLIEITRPSDDRRQSVTIKLIKQVIKLLFVITLMIDFD